MNPPAAAAYDAVVRHRRAEPAHSFSQRVRYSLLDLDEVDAEAGPSPRGWRPSGSVLGRFHRGDYFDGSDQPLRPAVLDLVEERTGRRPAGPVRMLTQLRTMGWLFNPLSVYYCTTADGAELDTLVLEVSNTPWHERHWYVLGADEVAGRGEPFAKAFHVSPFMPMDLTYRCRAPLPGDRLALRLELAQVGADGVERRVFDADVTGRRVGPEAASLVRLAAGATQTVRVSAGIYAHAARLWRRGARFHGHPGRHSDPAPSADLTTTSRRIP